MKGEDTLRSAVLANNISAESIKEISDLLDGNRIRYVYISGGTKIPYPIGIRVLEKDYDTAITLIKDIDIRRESGVVLTSDSQAVNKIMPLILFGGIAAFIVFVVISAL